MITSSPHQWSNVLNIDDRLFSVAKILWMELLVPLIRRYSCRTTLPINCTKIYFSRQWGGCVHTRHRLMCRYRSWWFRSRIPSDADSRSVYNIGMSASVFQYLYSCDHIVICGESLISSTQVSWRCLFVAGSIEHDRKFQNHVLTDICISGTDLVF